MIPENILKRMRPEDRRQFGKAGLTATEAGERYDLRREKDLQKEIAQWLSLHGFWFVQSRMDKKTRTAKGTPDFIVCVRGRMLCIEAKSMTGMMTDDQRIARKMIKMSGGTYIVARILGDVIEAVRR